MNILVFNSKGGSGKSVTAREIIAAPIAQQIIIVEIDTLNQTQLTYKKQFKDVIELDKNQITELLSLLNQYDNVVIDVGADNLTKVIDTMMEYQLFEDIDLVLIPLTQGRSDCENALKTYMALSVFAKRIMFAFSRFKKEESLEKQYPVFFANYQKSTGNSFLEENDYVTINDSDIFTEAQFAKKLVVEFAEDIDYKEKALEAKRSNKIDLYHELMKKELFKRAAKILLTTCIMPAHNKIMYIGNE